MCLERDFNESGIGSDNLTFSVALLKALKSCTLSTRPTQTHSVLSLTNYFMHLKFLIKLLILSEPIAALGKFS